jgi:DDE superfamily endonuclease
VPAPAWIARSETLRQWSLNGKFHDEGATRRWIMDNLHQTHDHPRFLALPRRLRIHPVWTPTEASWLNLIEAHFGALKRFTLANTDDPSHAVRRRRVYHHLRYRHRKLGTQEHRLTEIRALGVNKLESH